MPFILPNWINLALVALVIGFAALAGDPEERIFAGVLAAEWLYGLVSRHAYGENLATVLALQVGEFLILAALALRRERWWLLAAGAVALTEILTIAAQMLLHAHGWAYGTAMLLWGHLNHAILAAATWRSWRRRGAAAAPALA